MAASLLAGSLLPAMYGTPAYAEAHVDNPFVGATGYVNPDYAKEVDGSIARVSDPALKGKMQTVKSYPTAVWLDRIDAIKGGSANAGRLSLEEHLDAALAQKQGNTPITASFVIYDLPGRDCHALASNGELPLTQEALQRYKTEYIDVIAETFANPKYKDIRIVNVIEPDSLPNLVTNLSDARCAAANSSGIYVEGVQYALNKLHAIPNTYNYLDIGHSGWLGWDNNRSATITLFTNVVRNTTAGLSSIDGFITNTANTTPLHEPNLPNPDLNIGGQPIKSSKYYEWNPYFDESDFTVALYNDFVRAGFPSSIGMLIDTGRNGWGGPNRPTMASGSDINTYVNSGRVDRRAHRGNWCNNSGAGIGTPPTAAPAAHLDAYVWVKPPGESDGSSSLIPNNEGKGFDRMCDPTFTTPDGVLTGALPNAPISGAWFHDQFVMLINNAYPVLGTSTTPPVTPPVGTVPTAPTGLKAAAGDAQVKLNWSSTTGADHYVVKRATSENGPFTTLDSKVTTTLYTDKAVTNGTTYYYKVSAVNSVGTGSDSAAVNAKPAAVVVVPPVDPEPNPNPNPNPTPAGNLSVQYRAADTNVSDMQMKPFFNIKNNGTTPVNLSDLTLRYYFTPEGSQSMSSWIDWAKVGQDNITRTFGNGYVELSFSSAAGSLQPGGESGEIQLRMAKSDWSVMDESNDYSFDASKSSYTDWNKVTLYQGGKLVWGMEP
nr:glycoside hydrolase family 6 protein [Paenibacillus wulumuqiensis]